MYWDTRNEDFATTLGGVNAVTRVIIRNHIIAKGYKSVLDFGCGMAMDYEPLKAAGIEYVGVDACDKFARYNLDRGVPVMKKLRAQNSDDRCVDFAYCRHVLEHLTREEMEAAVRGMMRISKDGIALVLASVPYANQDSLSFDASRNLNWNAWAINTYFGAAGVLDATIETFESRQGHSSGDEMIIWIDKRT